jgi:hypothetical protein
MKNLMASWGRIPHMKKKELSTTSEITNIFVEQLMLIIKA